MSSIPKKVITQLTELTAELSEWASQRKIAAAKEEEIKDKIKAINAKYPLPKDDGGKSGYLATDAGKLRITTNTRAPKFVPEKAQQILRPEDFLKVVKVKTADFLLDEWKILVALEKYPNDIITEFFDEQEDTYTVALG